MTALTSASHYACGRSGAVHRAVAYNKRVNIAFRKALWWMDGNCYGDCGLSSDPLSVRRACEAEPFGAQLKLNRRECMEEGAAPGLTD